MNWSNKVVSDELDSRGKTIDEIMGWYFSGSLIVNRKYQRKLVWDLEEKRYFIDSIFNKFPTPSLILAKFLVQDSDSGSHYQYEIIDGLQRLNAIVSFVLNEFSFQLDGSEGYYNLNCTQSTILAQGKGLCKQKGKVLDHSKCAEFGHYTIPVVITEQRDEREQKIEQIFSRVNSTGRKLSRHDLRQASSADVFPDLVRRIAAYARAESTVRDTVSLNHIEEISLKSEGLNYGIDPKESFWIRNDIMLFKNFRQSKDEELIASALAVALLGDEFSITADNLDALYRPEGKYAVQVSENLKKAGIEEVYIRSIDVINTIDAVFQSVGSTFSKYLYSEKAACSKDKGFLALFIALYRLSQESYVVSDHRKVAACLQDKRNSTFASISKDSSNANCRKVTSLLKSSLTECMDRELPKKRSDDDSLLEKLLSLSKIETQMVEFKLGIFKFGTSIMNQNVISKICRTLVAMANTKNAHQETGYILLGVADNEKAFEDWKREYNSPGLRFGSHFIVGVDSEAAACCHDTDQYQIKLCERLEKENISEPLKSNVLANLRTVDFKGKALVILPAVWQGKPSYYNGQYFVRSGSSSKHIPEKDRKEYKQDTDRKVIQDGASEIILKMLGKGKTSEEIASLTDVPVEEIMKIKQSNK